MKLPNFAYRIPILNSPLENKVWNLIRQDKDQRSFNSKHAPLLGSVSAGLCMQLEPRALCSGDRLLRKVQMCSDIPPAQWEESG